MIKIEEAGNQDFEEIYYLLKRLNDTSLSKEQWKKVFEKHFKTEKDHFGYMLKDDDEIVGFFGTIFSERVLNGEEVKFCNTHSWIVDQRYKSKGLLLLNKIHKLKDHVLTNFSASEGPLKIMTQFGWEKIAYTNSIVFNGPEAFLKRGDKIVVKNDDIENHLSGEDLKVFRDHKKLNCNHALFLEGDNKVYFVIKEVSYFPARLRFIQKILPFSFKMGQIYYVSDIQCFRNYFDIIKKELCRKFKWIGVIIQDQLIEGIKHIKSKKYYKKRPVLIKSNTDASFSNLDLLYSEIFLLDLQ